MQWPPPRGEPRYSTRPRRRAARGAMAPSGTRSPAQNDCPTNVNWTCEGCYLAATLIPPDGCYLAVTLVAPGHATLRAV